MTLKSERRRSTSSRVHLASVSGCIHCPRLVDINSSNPMPWRFSISSRSAGYLRREFRAAQSGNDYPLEVTDALAIARVNLCPKKTKSGGNCHTTCGSNCHTIQTLSSVKLALHFVQPCWHSAYIVRGYTCVLKMLYSCKTSSPIAKDVPFFQQSVIILPEVQGLKRLRIDALLM